MTSEELLIADAGISRGEIDEFLVDGRLGHEPCELTPISAVFPMGFGWSSFYAQSYMVDCCLAAGFATTEFLIEEHAILCIRGQAVSVATDDVLHFLRALALATYRGGYGGKAS